MTKLVTTLTAYSNVVETEFLMTLVRRGLSVLAVISPLQPQRIAVYRVRCAHACPKRVTAGKATQVSNHRNGTTSGSRMDSEQNRLYGDILTLPVWLLIFALRRRWLASWSVLSLSGVCAMNDRSRPRSLLAAEQGLDIEIGSSGDGQQQSAQIFAAVLDAFAAAVCIVEANCRVRALNLAAHRSLADRQDLFIDRQFLSCVDPKARARLLRAVSTVCTLPGVGQDSFRIPGSHDRRLQVDVSALRPFAFDGSRSPEPLALVLFGQSENEHYTEERLRRLFGLSVAEACLLKELLSGKRLDECAESRGTTVGTARTQLKAIFTKTDTSSQGQLVAIAKALPAIVPQQLVDNRDSRRRPGNVPRRSATRAPAPSAEATAATTGLAPTAPLAGRADAETQSLQANPWRVWLVS